MNSPSPTLRPFTGVPIVDAMTNGTYWVLDQNKTLTWAMADFGQYQWSNPVIQTDFASAYASFAAFIDVKFQYAGHYTAPASAPADLVLSIDGSNTFFSSTNTWAEGFFPNSALTAALLPTAASGIYTSAPGDIWFNLNSTINSQSSYAPGTVGFAAAIHEIGHTLGLKHPHDDGGTGHPLFSAIGASILDVDYVTIMSYNDSYPLNSLQWHPATPMILDVIALQSIYGPNLSVHTGNDTYVITNNNMFQTIFDPLGVNTLDFRQSGHSWSISLNTVDPGPSLPYEIGISVPNDETLPVPSSLYWFYGNFQIVYLSNQNDSIHLAPYGGTVYIGRGSDTIVGSSGLDTVVFPNGRGGYSVSTTSAGIIVTNTTGASGADFISNVEQLKFADVTLVFDLTSAADKNVYLLYQAAFAREPDNLGFRYWAGVADTTHLSPIQLADQFLAAPEFTQTYGAHQSDTAYATAMYTNVLGRAPDPAGLSYWVGNLTLGEARDKLLVDFALSAENAALVGTHVSNGYWTI